VSQNPVLTLPQTPGLLREVKITSRRPASSFLKGDPAPEGGVLALGRKDLSLWTPPE
jgi:hypothetical protein